MRPGAGYHAGMVAVNDNEILNNLAANVERLIADRGWSRRELARRVGENPVTINRLCNGENMPGTGVSLRVAAVLGVPLEQLAAPAGEAAAVSA